MNYSASIRDEYFFCRKKKVRRPGDLWTRASKFDNVILIGRKLTALVDGRRMQIIRLDERITRFVDDINNARNEQAISLHR